MTTVEEALKLAAEYEKNGNISTSAKALIVLAHKVQDQETTIVHLLEKSES